MVLRLLLGLLAMTVGGAVSAAAADVVLSQQEINDAIRWGIEHNRSPEDIHEDIDGLNNARGGSGPVPLPVELQSIDTPDGRVTVTEIEASDYYMRTGRINGLRAEGEIHKDALKALETESVKWAGLEQVPVARTAAAYQELKDAYGDLQADLILIKAKVLLVNRRPTADDYGWAYRDYPNYEEALAAWKRRRDKLDALNDERIKAESDYVDRIQKMTDQNPTSSEGTSMMNRPKAMLDEIGHYQDMHREEIVRIRTEIESEEEILRQLRERAKGSGGPPVVLPTGDKGEKSGAGDSGNEEGGEGTAEEGESIDKMLDEFGAEGEESGNDESRTELVNQEILVDIQARFDAAVREFDQCSADFEARLNSLSGVESHHICSDPGLAAAFGCAENQLHYCETYYRDAHERIAAADRSVDWRRMRMDTELITDGRSAVSPMDQITIILINTKYEQTTAAARQLREMLQSAAPGCDPDDLKNASAWTSDEPQPPGDERGSGTGARGDGSGSTGGSDVAEEVHFRKIMGPSVQGSEQAARCEGGSLTLKRTSMPDFPDEIWPSQTYNVDIQLRWETQGDAVEGVDVSVSAFFMDPNNVKIQEFHQLSSQGVVPFSFGTNDVDFSREGGVITISYGGRIDAENASATTGGTVIVQAYERVGN